MGFGVIYCKIIESLIRLHIKKCQLILFWQQKQTLLEMSATSKTTDLMSKVCVELNVLIFFEILFVV